MFKAGFVITENGKKPFWEFLNKLSEDEQADVFAGIDKLCELLEMNTGLPEKLSKHLGSGIFEMRLTHANKITRSFYFYIKDKTIIFTHGFVKKSAKTPRKEIERAVRLRKLYFENNRV